jgi:hypothetical protein
LLPAFANGPVAGVTVEEVASTAPKRAIPRVAPQSRDALAARYAAATIASYPPAPRRVFAATELREALAGAPAPNAPKPAERKSPDRDAFDALLERTGVSPADFGTFAHRAIEARFTGLEPAIPDELRTAVDSLADRFFASELGGLAREADFLRSEYGFLTRYEALSPTAWSPAKSTSCFARKDAFSSSTIKPTATRTRPSMPISSPSTGRPFGTFLPLNLKLGSFTFAQDGPYASDSDLKFHIEFADIWSTRWIYCTFSWKYREK